MSASGEVLHCSIVWILALALGSFAANMQKGVRENFAPHPSVYWQFLFLVWTAEKLWISWSHTQQKQRELWSGGSSALDGTFVISTVAPRAKAWIVHISPPREENFIFACRGRSVMPCVQFSFHCCFYYGNKMFTGSKMKMGKANFCSSC